MTEPEPPKSNKAQTSAQAQSETQTPPMFRPPINRAMRVLDRSFFRKTVPLSAAAVFNNSDIARVRGVLHRSQDALALPRINGIREFREDGDGVVRKCILLREGVRFDDAATWSPRISELVEMGTIGLRPYQLMLGYDDWSYVDIISAILPEEALTEIPVGFTQVGHIAHLNLREHYLPYKYLIAEVLKDKNKAIRTVINKTEDVGSHSEFRTFPFELLAGDNDTRVIQHEQDCEFHFDYARVYWNSRLDTEHRRLVEKFGQGQMVCDVMAGVGPFAVPAGKRRIFVWANDFNPHGWEVMEDAVRRNKVKDFVRAFNMDGRKFIRWSAKALLEEDPVTVRIQPKARRERSKSSKPGKQQQQQQQQQEQPPPPAEEYTRPQIFDHYVMNLPATAVEFLDAFRGVYAGRESLFTPHTSQRLPMIHVYCFSGHSENPSDDHQDICKRISERIGYTITPEDRQGGSGNPDIELELYDVRVVSPKKQMFCASFRLPREVAFERVD